MKDTQELVTQAAFARSLKVSKATVTKWKSRGWLKLSGNLVDAEASMELLDRYRAGGAEVEEDGVNDGVNAVNAAPERVYLADPDDAEQVAADILAAGGYETWTFDQARRVKESYLALLSQLRYDEASKQVVAVAEVAAAVGAEYAQVRTKLLAIPTERAPELHRLRTVDELRDALERIITEALEALTYDRDK